MTSSSPEGTNNDSSFSTVTPGSVMLQVKVSCQNSLSLNKDNLESWAVGFVCYISLLVFPWAVEELQEEY